MNTDDKILEELVVSYKAPDEVRQLISGGAVLLVVGATGAGKNSILQGLVDTAKYSQVISHTTRKPRVNNGVPEKDGVDYFFVSPDKMAGLLREHKLVEAKYYSGNVYGTSIKQIKEAHDANTTALCDIEVQGVAEYKALSPGVKAIFIAPPDFEQWMKRLANRHGDDAMPKEELDSRLKTAINEFETALSTDYFDFIVNDNLEEAIKQADIIARAINSRTDTSGARVVAEKILDHLKKQLS